MTKQKPLATLFILALVLTNSGCSNRFVAGVRKLFVKPVTASAKYTVAGVRKLFNGSGSDSPGVAQTEQAYQEVRPVVTIEDGAGAPSGKSEIRNPKSETNSNVPNVSDFDIRASDFPAKPGGLDDVITPAQAAHWRELAVAKPYDAVVRYNVGRLYLQQGLLEEATYEFDMAASLDPKLTYAFVLLGRTLRMRGLHDLAIAKLNVAMQLQPDLPLTYVDAGVCWDERGHHGKARDAYLKALSLTPRDARIYNNIGYSFFLEGEYKEAITQYRKALQLDPENPQINNNLALAYATQQKWDRALFHFTRALGAAAAQNNIGHLLLRAGRVDEAVAHLELAVSLNPKSVRALGNLESALRLKGRIDDAEKLHAQLVEVEKARGDAGRTVTTAAHEQPQ